MHDQDIAKILNTWPYEQGKLNARIVEAADGRSLIQIRIELGIIQMEMRGRPDGVGQYGFSSLLALIEDRKVPESLDPDTCRRLREEGVQRSHRSAALFALGKWAAVIHDCDKNLELFNLCKDHAQEQMDAEALEQFRAAVIAMRARAGAEWAVEEGHPVKAVEAVNHGLKQLQESLGEGWESSNEVQLLRGMKEVLIPQLPPSEKADLKERLLAAIAAENYELAAILRDELRLLRD